MKHSHAKESRKHQRKTIFLRHRFQLRYAFLVAGSLLVLLLFAGVHGIFIATTFLPSEALAEFQPTLISSTMRLFLVGILYIGIVTMAAVFLSHRSIGPTERLEEEINKMASSKRPAEPLQLREGDELEGVIRAFNKFVKKGQKK